jgi:hypothetical protein
MKREQQAISQFIIPEGNDGLWHLVESNTFED